MKLLDFEGLTLQYYRDTDKITWNCNIKYSNINDFCNKRISVVFNLLSACLLYSSKVKIKINLWNYLLRQSGPFDDGLDEIGNLPLEEIYSNKEACLSFTGDCSIYCRVLHTLQVWRKVVDQPEDLRRFYKRSWHHDIRLL